VPDLFDPFRARPDRSAVLTDFDGTLSPIVEDWTAATPLPRTREVLEALATRYAVVGVISGRPVDYLIAHLGTRLRLAGLYGLEGLADGERITAGDAERWREVIDDAVDAATTRFGTLVEHKGLSMTVHFRTRPELEDDVRSWAAALQDTTTLELRSAKASVEWCSASPPASTTSASSATTSATCRRSPRSTSCASRACTWPRSA
jgi:trehalose 6-phosphate phosphatase